MLYIKQTVNKVKEHLFSEKSLAELQNNFLFQLVVFSTVSFFSFRSKIISIELVPKNLISTFLRMWWWTPREKGKSLSLIWMRPLYTPEVSWDPVILTSKLFRYFSYNSAWKLRYVCWIQTSFGGVSYCCSKNIRCLYLHSWEQKLCRYRFIYNQSQRSHSEEVLQIKLQETKW